jgi:lipoprotein LpqH
VVRSLVVGVASAAVVLAGLTGCSSKKSEETTGASEPNATSAVTASSGSVTAQAGAGTAMVTIDGQPQEIKGQVACTTAAGTMNIAVGDQTTGIGVMMSPDASKVTSVGLGNVNGVAMGYQEGAPGGSASVTKDGQTYTITGTATGVDIANPMQPMTKPFEIKVSCP